MVGESKFQNVSNMLCIFYPNGPIWPPFFRPKAIHQILGTRNDLSQEFRSTKSIRCYRQMMFETKLKIHQKRLGFLQSIRHWSQVWENDCCLFRIRCWHEPGAGLLRSLFLHCCSAFGGPVLNSCCVGCGAVGTPIQKGWNTRPEIRLWAFEINDPWALAFLQTCWSLVHSAVILSSFPQRLVPAPGTQLQLSEAFGFRCDVESGGVAEHQADPRSGAQPIDGEPLGLKLGVRQ